MFIQRIESPVGTLTLTSEDGFTLSGLYTQEHKLAKQYLATEERPCGIFEATATQLQEYFAGERTKFELPLSLSGTWFEVSVWEVLKNIPFGQTITYAELARRVGNPQASRAVGGANGRNPISIIVPCHRMVGSKGLTGYAGGIECKKSLLELEWQHSPVQKELALV